MCLDPSRCLTAAPAWAGRATRGLARWLIVLLLVFDHFGATWHTHRHGGGVDGFVTAATDSHAQGTKSHIDAPDDRPSWTHATLGMRIEAGPTLTAASDKDSWPALFWPPSGLARPVDVSTRLVTASQHEPPTPAYRSLPPAAQAPPRRA